MPITEPVPTSIASPQADKVETLRDFDLKIHKATLDGDEWVETSPEIIRYYNKNGLGPNAEYFIFQGIKVCEYGKSEAIIKKLDRQIGNLLYGDEEAKVNQGKVAMPSTGGSGLT